METTRQTTTAGNPAGASRPTVPTEQRRVEINVAFVPTLDGVKSLLDGVSTRLPDQAPPAPPRKGTAWQAGYMDAMADARETITWVRDGLRFRDDVRGAHATTGQMDMTSTEPQAVDSTRDYRWVRAWERMMASAPDRIEEQVARARSEGAPPTATYRRAPGDWSTIDDIISLDTQRRLGLPSTPPAAVMTAHRKASEALHAVTGALADLRSVELPDSVAIERADLTHDLDRAARFLAHAQLRASELAANLHAEAR